MLHSGGKIQLDDINFEKGYSTFQAYAQTKLANILFCKELSKRLSGTNVTANSLDPGIVNTDITKTVAARSFFLWAYFVFSKYVTSPLFMKTPVQGAQTMIHVAVAEELEKVSGKYFRECGPVSPAPQAEDEEMAAKLWTLSEKMVGLTDTSL